MLTATDAENRYRFFRAARILSRLDHPNVLAVYDHSDDNAPAPFIASELIVAPTLRTLLDRRGTAFDPAMAVSIARDLALALEHAHSRDVVHRDVKPENIFYTTAGRVVLADFGLAKSLSKSGSFQTTLHGSIAYMAPEQFRGVAADARTDIHALGVVLFEMLAGSPPYDAKNIGALITAIETGARRALPAGVGPEALVRLVDQMLAVKPEDRPAHARAVAERLGNLNAPEANVDSEDKTDLVPRDLLKRLNRGKLGPRTLALGALVLVATAAITYFLLG
jgi:serine/threonine-protein kinase